MTDPFDGDVEVAELHAAQVREWSKWEAREPIYVGAALAFNTGDAVPQDNVTRHGYAASGQVRLRPGWVVDNPDDDDVKTFTAWAKTHPDHPDVKAWEAERDAKADAAVAAAEDNPFAPKPEAPARRRATPDTKASAVDTKADTKATATSTDNKE
jgi:hypothetical protein